MRSCTLGRIITAVEIMRTETLWKITCMEDDNPGLWQRWLKCQCVTVGYAPRWECKMEGGKMKGAGDWIKARNALKSIEPGTSSWPRFQGVGSADSVRWWKCELTTTSGTLWSSIPDDEPGDGPEILVRWDLEHGPDSLDQIGPASGRLRHRVAWNLNRIWDKSVKEFEEIMANPANWVGLVGHFGYEWALSDYIALYPHRLEDGLRPHPSKRFARK